jgi:DNA-binding NarL/FixJ family response regulator
MTRKGGECDMYDEFEFTSGIIKKTLNNWLELEYVTQINDAVIARWDVEMAIDDLQDPHIHKKIQLTGEQLELLQMWQKGYSVDDLATHYKAPKETIISRRNKISKKIAKWLNGGFEDEKYL